jgi:hypothetical protein
MSISEVRIIEDSIGYFQERTFSFDFPAVAQGTVSKLSNVIPFVVLAWHSRILADPSQRGDFLSVSVAPNTAIGTLDAAATAGQTTITVDGSAATYAWPGEYLIFNDLTVEEIQIKSVSGTTVTLVTPLINNHDPATPLGLTVKLVDHSFMDGKTDIHIGIKGVRGHLLQADTELMLELTNSSGRAKTVHATLEYYTGG